MKESDFPIWYRPYIVLPLLGLLYVTIPMIWDFSPHVLTHSMPYFLVGASDYGVGNIYAFTKLAFWIGLVLGAIANARSNHPAALGYALSVRWRLRRNAWCLISAIIMATALVPFMTGNDDAHETWVLTAYLCFGMIGILALHSIAQLRSWAYPMRMTVALLASLAWGFVRVSVEHP